MKESSHVLLASPSGFSTVGLRPAFPSRGARERCLNRAEGTILSFYQESIVHCLNQQFPTRVIAPLKVKVFLKFMWLLQVFKLVRQTIDSTANFLTQSTSDYNNLTVQPSSRHG